MIMDKLVQLESTHAPAKTNTAPAPVAEKTNGQQLPSGGKPA
jgi:hypothetical protein